MKKLTLSIIVLSLLFLFVFAAYAQEILGPQNLVSSFDNPRQDNSQIPNGWFYSLQGKYWKSDSDLDDWRTDRFYLSDEGIKGKSLFFDGRKERCCVGNEFSGTIQSRTFHINPRNEYSLEFYYKTEITYSFPYGFFYVSIHFDNKDEEVSQLYVEFNETNVSYEILGKSFEVNVIDFSSLENGWQHVKINVKSLDSAIDNGNMEISEVFTEQSGTVLINNLFFGASQ